MTDRTTSGADSIVLPVTAGVAPGQLAVSVDQAADLIGCSRAYAFQLVRAGTLPSLKLGRRRLIRTAALAQFLADLEAAQATDAPEPL